MVREADLFFEAKGMALTQVPGQECAWHATAAAETMGWREDVVEDVLSKGQVAGDVGVDFLDLIGLWSTCEGTHWLF